MIRRSGIASCLKYYDVLKAKTFSLVRPLKPTIQAQTSAYSGWGFYVCCLVYYGHVFLSNYNQPLRDLVLVQSAY